MHLDSGDTVDPAEFEVWSTMEDGIRFITACSARWCDADIASGADPDFARAAADRTTAFYTGAELPEAH